MLTGIVKKPEIRMYWSTDETTSTPFFGKTMSRNRYQEISAFLHFNDNEKRPAPGEGDDQDRLFKLRPIVDYLVEKFKSLYAPHKQISIDEGTLK